MIPTKNKTKLPTNPLRNQRFGINALIHTYNSDKFKKKTTFSWPLFVINEQSPSVIMIYVCSDVMIHECITRIK